MADDKKITIEIDDKGNPKLLPRKEFMKMPEGYGMVVPTKFIEQGHRREFVEEFRDFLEKEYGPAKFISASQIGDILKGSDVQGWKILKPFLEKKLTQNISLLEREQITTFLKETTEMFNRFESSQAHIFGDAQHRILELINKGIIGEGGRATREQIIKYIQSEEAKRDEKLAEELFTKRGVIIEKSLETLLKNIESKQIFAQKLGLKEIPLSEVNLSAFYKIGDQIVQLTGIFDELYQAAQIIGDFKTGYVSKHYAPQMNALAALVKTAYGFSPKEAKLFQLPRKDYIGSGITTVPISSEQDIMKMLGAAYQISQEQDPEKRWALIRQAEKQGIERGLRYIPRIEKQKFKGYKEGQEFEDIVIDGRRMFNFANVKDPEKAADDLMKALQGASIDWLDIIAQKVFRQDWKTLEYTYGSEKQKPFWEAVRKKMYPFASQRPGFVESVGGFRPVYYYEAGDAQSAQKKLPYRAFSIAEKRRYEEQPDYWEAELERDISLLEKGAERGYVGYDEASIAELEQRTANRLGRLLDFSDRINKIFNAVAEQIGEGFVGSDIAKPFLAQYAPALYEKYKRSEQLLENFPFDEPVQQQIEFLTSQKDIFSAEESSIQKALYIISQAQGGNVLQDVFKKRVSWIGKGFSTHVAPEVFANLISGVAPGIPEEESYRPFEKQRLIDMYLGQTSPIEREQILSQYRAELESKQVDTEFDFYKNRLTEMQDSLEVTGDQIDKFIDYLKRLEQVAEQSGLTWQEVLGSIDTKTGFVIRDSKLAKSLESLGGEQPIADLYLPKTGKRGLGYRTREKLFEAVFDMNVEEEFYNVKAEEIENLIVQKEKEFNEQGRIAQQNMERVQEALISMAEKENAKIARIERENARLDEEYAATQKQRITEAEALEKRKEEASQKLNEAIESTAIVQEQVESHLSDSFDKKDEVQKREIKAEEDLIESYNQGKVDFDKKGQKLVSTQINSDGKVIGLTYSGKTQRAFADYKMPLVEWIESRKGTDKAETASLLETILGGVKSYKKGSGQLSAAGQKEFDSIMSRIYEDYAPKGSSFSGKMNIDQQSGDIEITSNSPVINILGDNPTINQLGTVQQSFGDNVTKEKPSKKAQTDQEDVKNLRLYNQLLNERLKVETQIQKYTRQRQLSTTEKEQDALDRAIFLEQQRLDTINLQIEAQEKLISEEERTVKRSEYEQARERKFAGIDVSRRGMTNIWDAISRQMGMSFQRFVEYGALYKAQAFLQQSIQKVIQLTQEYDQTLMNLRIVTGYSKNEATTLIHTYNDLAEQLGSITKAVAASAEGWLRQGYSVSEANDLIKASTYLSTLGQMSAEDATRSLTSALKGFKLEATSVMQVVDELTALDMNFATSAKSIAESLSVVASVANSAGLSLETTSAMLTTIMDVTQQTGSEAGNALKTILSRYGTVKGGSFTSLMGDEEDVKNLNDVEKVLNSIGITIRNSTMEFRDFGEVMDDLNDKWISLTTVERNAVATAMAGTRQRNAFLSLMDNYSKYQDALQISEGAGGTAEEKYEAVVDSLSYAVNKLTTAWEKLSQTMNLNPVFKFFTDTTAILLEHLPKIITLFTTLLAVSNAYKIPTSLKNFAGAFSIKGLFGGLTAEGRLQRSLGLNTKESSGIITKNITNPVVNSIHEVRDELRKQNSTIEIADDIAEKGDSGQLTISEQNRKLIRKQTIGAMAAGGVVGAIGGMMSYGDWTTSGGLMRKAAGSIAGGASGALMGSGHPVAIAIGMAIQVITPFLVQIIKSQEEERQERVEEARQRLSALDNLSSTISSTLTSAMKSVQDRTAEDYKQMRESYQELSDALYSYQKDGEEADWSFYEDFQEALVDLGYSFSDVDSAMQELVNGTDKASQVMQAYSLAQRRRIALETELAQEDQKASINKKLSEAETEEQAEKYRAQLENLRRDVREQYLQATLISSGLSTTSSLKMGQYSLNAVIQTLAGKWVEEMPSVESFVFGGMGKESGQVSSGARQEIESMLRASDIYSNLFQNAALTYGQMRQSFDIASSLTVEEIEKIASEDEFLFNTLQETAEDGEQKMRNFAHSLGLTAEQAESMFDSLQHLTSSDAIAGIDGVVSRYDTLGSIFEGLSKSSKITTENLNKIMSSYSWLLVGEGGRISQENILGNLVDLIMGSGEIPTYFASQIVQNAMTDTGVFNVYRTALQSSEIWDKLDVETKGAIQNKSTYKDIQGILENIDDKTIDIGKMQEIWSQAVASSYSNLEIYDQLLSSVYEYENMIIDDQISNIQSFKEALGSVNNLREKELKLIKAKQALEEAKEEKSLVYRAGIGWSYVTNAQAVAEAQENLDNLQLELQQDNLQYQIDQLQTQKEILSALQDSERREQLNKIAKAIGEQTGGGLFGWLTGGAKDNLLEVIEEAINYAMGTSEEAQAEADIDKLKEFQRAQEEYEEYTNSDEYIKAINKGGFAASEAKSRAANLLSSAQTAGKAVSSINFGEKKYQKALEKSPYTPESVAGIISSAEGIQKEASEREDIKMVVKGVWNGKDLIMHFKDGDVSQSLHLFSPDQLSEQFGKASENQVAVYNEDGTYSRFESTGQSYVDILNDDKIPDYSLIRNDEWENYAGMKYKGGLYQIGTHGGDILETKTIQDMEEGKIGNGVYIFDRTGGSKAEGDLYNNEQVKRAVEGLGYDYKYASGTLDFQPNALINEYGSEAIVTPYGTLTALPTHTGIVPADLTSNLYNLGEVAPNLIGTLSSLRQGSLGSPFATNEDNSTNINNLNASFNVTEDFDFDQFLVKAKNFVAISKNNR